MAESLYFRSLLDTPIGILECCWSASGIHVLAVADRGAVHRRRAGLSAVAEQASPWDGAILRWFEDPSTDLASVPVRSHGTDFQRRIWRMLRRVRPGQTTTYGELAQSAGAARAARATGRAVGANPILVLIPCHRVLAAGGALGGFSAGLERKRWLLAHEGVKLRTPTGAE